MNINNFINRKQYETKLIIKRRHFLTFIPTILLTITLLAVPYGVYYLIVHMFYFLMESQIWSTLIILLGSAYLLSVALFFFSFFIGFYLDVTVITNDRMIDVEQGGLFSRSVAEVDLYQIQDASSEIKGLLPSLFNYGTVKIQTAGPVPKFIMEDVYKPHEMRQIILDLASADKQFHSKAAAPTSAPASNVPTPAATTTPAQ